MKTVILAGGRGTRLSEETTLRPKPMVEIGGKPILWHIMRTYASAGINDFLVACGYKGDMIKHYFANYYIQNRDFFANLSDGSLDFAGESDVDWRVGAIDTGLDTMTGGRILRLKPWLQDGTFMVTYGDGVGNIDIEALLAFHRSHGKIATVTAVHPPSRFGALIIDENDNVGEFSEKPQMAEGWINGGYFVFEPQIFDYLTDDSTILERSPLERLAADQQLAAFKHPGFWQPMDTIREKEVLESHWESGNPPWKTW